MSTEENKPKTIKFYRIVPQLKTFPKGTLLKNKIDLYYSTEENIVETGSDDGFAPGINLSSTHNSFNQSEKFIPKETVLLFTEAAQFRANDNNVYVRAQLMTNSIVVWVNVLKIPNKIWAFKIKSEQKEMIKKEITEMFEEIKM